MLNEELLDLAKKSLEDLRGWTSDLSRWSFLDIKNGLVLGEAGYVCVAGLDPNKFKNKNRLLLFSFNGEEPKNSRANGRAFKGGALSKKWLEFILGPSTPFPGAVSHIVNKDDIDWINEKGGFIFDETYLEQGGGELRGFLITSRYCQEFNGRTANWALMVDNLGMDPLITWIISMHYIFGDGWVITQNRAPDHAVAYEPYGLYLPNLYKRIFPFDGKLNNVGLKYCMDSLYSKKGDVYDIYQNSWDYTEDVINQRLWYGVQVGDNVKQAEEKILKALKELDNAQP